MQDRTSRDPFWLRFLNATVRAFIAAQVAFLLFVAVVALGIVVGIIGLAMNR